MAKRTFADLKKSMPLYKFNLLCREIATEYAYSDLSKATTYFTCKYNITKSCYQRVKEYAVIHFLVSDYVVSLMEEKASANQQRNTVGSSGFKVKNHYNKLRSKRKDFISSLAVEYAEHPEIPYRVLVANCGRSVEGYFSLIYIAFVGDYGITDDMAKKIIARMFSDCPSNDKIPTLCKAVDIFWSNRIAK